MLGKDYLKTFSRSCEPAIFLMKFILVVNTRMNQFR